MSLLSIALACVSGSSSSLSLGFGTSTEAFSTLADSFADYEMACIRAENAKGYQRFLCWLGRHSSRVPAWIISIWARVVNMRRPALVRFVPRWRQGRWRSVC